MGYEAALNAIEMANWDIKTIDLIVLATSTLMIYLVPRHLFKLNWGLRMLWLSI